MPVQDHNFLEFVQNWDRFKGRLVVFLGAGASIGATNAAGLPLPNAFELRNNLWKEFKIAPGKVIDIQDLKLMSLEHAAAIIETSAGRAELTRYLLKAFTCKTPLWQHLVLPYLNPLSLFTTNYDELIELGYRHHSTEYDLICDDQLPVDGRTALFKPHGSLGRSNLAIGKGGLVITQFDYFSMISEYRKMLKNAFLRMNDCCVIIAGYSFGDMDIGSELYSIRQESRGTKWYTIFPRDDAQVRKMYAERLGIDQIAMDLETFLKSLDQQVDFIPGIHKHRRRNKLRRDGVVV
jgi:hypothetical protein